MASSLLNAPHPDTIVTRYDLIRVTEAEKDQELKARRYYFERAARGDPEAKLMLKVHPRWRLKRWWKRGVGEIL